MIQFILERPARQVGPREAALRSRLAIGLSFCLLPAFAAAVTVAQYQRAAQLRTNYLGLADNLAERPAWIEGTSRFWYRKAVKGGHDFMLVEAATGEKKKLFDSAKMLDALAKATGEKFEDGQLPFTTIVFAQSGKAIDVEVNDKRLRVSLEDYVVSSVPDGGTTRRPQGLGAIWRRDEAPADRAVASPDGKWEILIRNYNLYLRAKGKQEGELLTSDGSEGNVYNINSLVWSPDSRKLAVYRVRPGFRRQVSYIESSPLDQLQPKSHSFTYLKPGDAVDLQQPVVFDVAESKQRHIDPALFANPYQLSRIQWRKDSSAFTFEYNQRGHQTYRVLEVSAATGAVRTVIAEEPKTFFCYSGKKFRHDVADGKEVIWMSERDGWNHLYLYDGITGKVKNQITKGSWVVRGVEKVDEEKRQIWFRASGMYPGKDPYFNHYYRIDFDGTRLTALTEHDANHSVSFSGDMQYYVDLWSRVDQPPIAELRRTSDRRLVTALEQGDITGLKNAGWRPPEVFTSRGRDGKTEIWGVIYKPSDFDPSKKYPVVEQIYAGPQDSFVPKSFIPWSPMQSLAELGFVVVQIDGMGTSNRSKAFHDVAWKNLADAGFPDRILWHKAVAAKYSWYDISRVGVYGHSAGGQNALGALLFHPEFYKVAVSSCGCHDNRMDKIWWNEQWMGWPLGPEYVACSNVENAHKLKGKLLLSVGELDDNVDPASTMQVVNALVKAGKTFDFIVLPGQRHSNGGSYGDRKRFDFFVRNLQGSEPPDWNMLDVPLPPAPGRR